MKLGKLHTAGLLSIALALSACGNETSDNADFPADDINLIITYAAGGQTDQAGRAIAAALEEKLGVTVVVENIEGASGSVGTGQLVRAEPDGYTIAMTTTSAVARVPLIQEVGYGLDDVQPLALAVQGDMLLLVREDSPYETAEEFFAAAEENPDEIVVGTAGAQTPHHVELERLRMDYGVSLRIVPHEGDAPNLAAVVGENQDAALASNNDATMDYIDDGQLRPLTVTSPERTDYLPDVPTLSELGYDDLVHGGSNYIVAGPAGMSDDVVSTYEETLTEILTDPETISIIGEIRVPTDPPSAAEMTEMLQVERDTLAPVLDELFD